MKWGRTKFILTCLIFFSLGFNLVLPFFTKQEPVSAAAGDIGAVVDTWDFNSFIGDNPGSTARMKSSQYYITAARLGYSDNDGWVYTYKIYNNNGTMVHTLVDSYEFDSTDGHYPAITYFADLGGQQAYAIVYDESEVSAAGKVAIIGVDDNGDNLGSICVGSLTKHCGLYPSILVIDSTHLMVAYQANAGGSFDFYLETLNLTYDGDYHIAVADTQVVDSTPTSVRKGPSICWVNGPTADPVTLAYQLSTSGEHGKVYTWNISSGWNIAAAATDSWDWISYIFGGMIKKIPSSTYYMVSYSDSSNDPTVKSFAISNAGIITETLIDALTFTSTDSYYQTLFPIDMPLGIWGCYVVGTHTVYSFYARASDGAIGNAANDTLDTGSAYTDGWASFTHCEDDYFLQTKGVSYYLTTFSAEVAPVYVKSWQQITSGWFRLGNSSSFGTPISGYVSFMNSSSFQTNKSGYFTLSNYSLFQTNSSGWFSLSNTSSFKTTSEGWFKFQSDKEWSSISSGWFKFNGARELLDVSTGYFTFSNGASWIDVTQTPIKQYENSYSVSAESSVFAAGWRSQIFTVGTTGANVNHIISQIALKMRKQGSPPTITVSIRLVSARKPTGGDLCSGTIAGSSLTGTADWYNISMSPSYTLLANTEYAIVVRCVGGDAANFVRLSINNPGTYSGGAFDTSTTSGSTWIITAFDAGFLEYGFTSYISGYFTFQNTATYKSVTSGYFRLGNASSWATLNSGYFTFGAPLPAWYNVNQGWLRFGNTATVHNVVSGYFSLQNSSVYQNINDGYFTFASGISWANVNHGYFNFGNLSSTKTITSGWFNLSNVSSVQTVTQGYFSFANIPAWHSVRSGYFRFSNVSAWTLITSGWFSFENVSNATPIVRILLPHPGETVRYNTPFLVTYSVYSSKKEPVNVSLQVIYLGESGWVNLTNQALNSDDYYLNSTIDISLVMAALGITADYNSPYTLNLNATNYVTHLYGDDQSNFKLRDATYDMIVLFFPLILLLLFSILAFWKQSKIILTATITTAILYATMLATQFAGTIDAWYVVLLIVYALALSTMYFFWKKKGVKAT